MIFLIRLLRKLPHSWAFDEHLTRCVWAHVWYDEALTLGKIFGRAPLDSADALAGLDASPITAADIRRTHELNEQFGWEKRYGKPH